MTTFLAPIPTAEQVARHERRRRLAHLTAACVAVVALAVLATTGPSDTQIDGATHDRTPRQLQLTGVHDRGGNPR